MNKRNDGIKRCCNAYGIIIRYTPSAGAGSWPGNTGNVPRPYPFRPGSGKTVPGLNIAGFYAIGKGSGGQLLVLDQLKGVPGGGRR